MLSLLTRSHASNALQEAQVAAAGWRALHGDLQRSLAPQRAWAAQLLRPPPARGPASFRSPGGAAGAAEEEDAGVAPAWEQLLGRELPMEGLVRQMMALVGSSAAFTRRRSADARTHGASDVETAWLVRIPSFLRRRFLCLEV